MISYDEPEMFRRKHRANLDAKKFPGIAGFSRMEVEMPIRKSKKKFPLVELES